MSMGRRTEFKIDEDEMDLFIDLLQELEDVRIDSDQKMTDPTGLFLGEKELTFDEVDDLLIRLYDRRGKQ